ncbi:GMC oxidoreductase [Tilletiaria anomala UBC 951]|uniref:GMC oxidoreductase n=1 Tax=Tilletiaria anomala (strain ATCC 24038 / CBS 436.72 / UBC 951) TaxID=1037660 RepID=A0A066VWJ9_TILAU|nr:GMC oxidoreductase [Tilletiaria anomala UBC 951]KDN46112.1 GMC oxidoreductase [Tilletiaria anomala UBC 951]
MAPIATDAEAFVSAHQDGVDFIVVGGGTAGLAVAVRLSEDPKVTVAVLESGGSALTPDTGEPNDPRIDTPGMFGAGLMTELDWKLHSEPGSGANEGVPSTYYPRGKVLGGSSALNFLVYDRASSVEYDGWEQLGNKGWNWDTLYRYMRKAEHFHLPSPVTAEALHIKPDAKDYGNSGPIQVSFPLYVGEQTRNWILALESLGIPRNDHSLAGNNVGASVQPSIIDPRDSTRSYAASAYLGPNLGRPNLRILTGATVERIEFAPGDAHQEPLVAAGVTFVATAGGSEGKRFTLRAGREVILSAGTVFSPAILERSGVGAASVLSKAGVPVRLELPSVGEGMQDHTYSSVTYELKQGSVTLDSLRNDPAFAKEQQSLYKLNDPEKGSIFTEGVPTVAYISLEELVNGDKDEVARLIKEADNYVESQRDKSYVATLEKQLEWLKKYPDQVGQMELIGVDGYFATSGAPDPGKNYLTLLAAQQHLFSRGSIHISSADVAVAPTIHTGYFSAPWDLAVATAGTKFLRKIATTQQYARQIEREVVPGPDADLEEYTRTVGTTTEYHITSTASMLPRDKGGVVDPELKVYGLKNVRVVDASIIPVNVSAHIQATVYGIAEAAADIIKRAHGLQASAELAAQQVSRHVETKLDLDAHNVAPTVTASS